MRIDVGHFRFGANPQTLGTGTTEWTLIVTLRVERVAQGPDGERARTARSLAILVPPLRGDHEPLVGELAERVFVRFQPKPDWLPWLRWPRVSDGVRAVEVTDDRKWESLVSCVRTLEENANRPDAYSEAVAMNALERIFLLVHAGQEREDHTMDKRVAKVTRFVERQLGKDVTVEAAASVVGLSPSRLSHLFREELGVTFSRYVQMERLKKARILLEDSSSTTEKIARELGMEPAYFSSWFRKWSGLSPRSYRSSWAR
jgi:AraC family transcriptional regulator of arabinose operon